MRIKTRILVYFLPLVLVSIWVMAWVSKRAVETVITEESAKRELTIAKNLAEEPGIVLGLRTGSEKLILPILQSAMENTDLVYAIALGPKGEVLAHTNVAETGKVYVDPYTLETLQTTAPGYRRLEIGGHPIMDLAYPVWDPDQDEAGEAFLLLGERDPQLRKRLGTLRIGLPLQESLKTADRISTQLLWIIAGVSAVGLVLAMFFTRRLLQPIQLLVSAAGRIGRGALGETVPVTSSDETGDLARSFNQMSLDLAETTVSKDFLDSILGDMLDALVVTSPEGQIRMINSSALELLDYSEEELIGRSVRLLFPEEEPLFGIGGLDELVEGGPVRNVEGALRAKEGREVPVLLNVSAFRDREGKVGGLIATARDIGDRKQMEEALRAARDELEHRVRQRTSELYGINESLQREVEERRNLEEQLRQSQKMEAIGTLAGGVAHDFNNQLAIIRGYVDMVMDELPEDSRVQRNLTEVSKAVQRSASLTEQLLVFSSKQPTNMRSVDLNHLLSDLRKMLDRLLREDISVETEFSEDLWTVRADTGNINQIITNLSVNARDAMPSGGTLHIATRNVVIDDIYCRQFREASPGRFVCLTVSDTGIGMDAQVRSRLFEPFFTTKGPGKGTGLGLSVVYGIVQAHEGWITVHSRPGEGSRFEIYLRATESGIRPSREEEGSGRLAQYRGEGERILLVEDEPALRDMTGQVLRELNYKVHACGTVSDAWSAFRETGGSFDIVLSDVVLPDGRGTDLVLQLAKEQPSLGALLVTGYTDDASEWERVREAGLTLLQKPVRTPELLAEIRRALESRAGV